MNRVKLDLFINYYLPITFEIKLFIPFTTSVVINIHSSPLIGNAVNSLHSTPSSLIPLHPLFISTIVTSWPTELVNIQSSLCHLLCTTHQFTPPVLLIGHWTGTTTAVDLQLTHPVPCLPLSLSPDQLNTTDWLILRGLHNSETTCKYPTTWTKWPSGWDQSPVHSATVTQYTQQR